MLCSSLVPSPDCELRGFHTLPASVGNLFDYLESDKVAACLKIYLQRATTDLQVVEDFIASFLIDDFAMSDEQQSPPTPLPNKDGEQKGDGEKDSTLDNGTASEVEVEEGKGEKKGRIVTCNGKEYVCGSFVTPVWPVGKDLKDARATLAAHILTAPACKTLVACRRRWYNPCDDCKARSSLENLCTQKRPDEKLALKQNSIKLPDSASRITASTGNARLHRLARIRHLVNPANDFLGALLDLPPTAQARLFKSEVSMACFAVAFTHIYECQCLCPFSRSSDKTNHALPSILPFIHPLSVFPSLLHSSLDRWNYHSN